MIQNSEGSQTRDLLQRPLLGPRYTGELTDLEMCLKKKKGKIRGDSCLDNSDLKKTCLSMNNEDAFYKWFQLAVLSCH